MRPNIILMTTDQQRVDSIGCYGSSFVHTPNLDRLAKRGVIFERTYCSSPVCTPSRASLFTGRRVSRHGAWNVGTSVPESEVMIQHHLAKLGYRTHHIGKLHFQPYDGTPGESREAQARWEERVPDNPEHYYGFESVEMSSGHSTYGVTHDYGRWVQERAGTTQFASRCLSQRRFGGEAYEWDIPLSLHNSRWIAERAKEFLSQQATSDQPFFLHLGYEDPHHPHAVPTEFARKLAVDKIPLPVYRAGELDDKPEHFRAVYEGRWTSEHPWHGKYPMAGQGGVMDYRGVSDEDARRGRGHYYALVELIDQSVGEVLGFLEDTEMTSRTIVVFTSDHGELLGDHGLWMKGPFHYESLIRVPLIVSGPGRLPEGRTCDDVVSLLDITPTLLGLCDCEVAFDMDGLDLGPGLRSGRFPNRDHALVECVDDPTHLRLKTIVSKRYKLTVYYGDYGLSYGELYDLQEDPLEHRNLWDDPVWQHIKADWLVRLLHDQEPLERRVHRISYA